MVLRLLVASKIVFCLICWSFADELPQDVTTSKRFYVPTVRPKHDGTNTEEDAIGDIKKITEIHDDGSYTTLCWTDIIIISGPKHGKETISREYAISFETPSATPVHSANRKQHSPNTTVPYLVIDRRTGKRDVYNFTIVSDCNGVVVKRYEEKRCGSGPIYVKDTEVVNSNVTKMQIKVTPRKQTLRSVNCYAISAESRCAENLNQKEGLHNVKEASLKRVSKLNRPVIHTSITGSADNSNRVKGLTKNADVTTQLETTPQEKPIDRLEDPILANKNRAHAPFYYFVKKADKPKPLPDQYVFKQFVKPAGAVSFLPTTEDTGMNTQGVNSYQVYSQNTKATTESVKSTLATHPPPHHVHYGRYTVPNIYKEVKTSYVTDIPDGETDTADFNAPQAHIPHNRHHNDFIFTLSYTPVATEKGVSGRPTHFHTSQSSGKQTKLPLNTIFTTWNTIQTTPLYLPSGASGSLTTLHDVPAEDENTGAQFVAKLTSGPLTNTDEPRTTPVYQGGSTFHVARDPPYTKPVPVQPKKIVSDLHDNNNRPTFYSTFTGVQPLKKGNTSVPKQPMRSKSEWSFSTSTHEDARNPSLPQQSTHLQIKDTFSQNRSQNVPSNVTQPDSQVKFSQQHIFNNVTAPVAIVDAAVPTTTSPKTNGYVSQTYGVSTVEVTTIKAPIQYSGPIKTPGQLSGVQEDQNVRPKVFPQFLLNVHTQTVATTATPLYFGDDAQKFTQKSVVMEEGQGVPKFLTNIPIRYTVTTETPLFGKDDTYRKGSLVVVHKGQPETAPPQSTTGNQDATTQPAPKDLLYLFNTKPTHTKGSVVVVHNGQPVSETASQFTTGNQDAAYDFTTQPAPNKLLYLFNTEPPYTKGSVVVVHKGQTVPETAPHFTAPENKDAADGFTTKPARNKLLYLLNGKPTHTKGSVVVVHKGQTVPETAPQFTAPENKDAAYDFTTQPAPKELLYLFNTKPTHTKGSVVVVHNGQTAPETAPQFTAPENKDAAYEFTTKPASKELLYLFNTKPNVAINTPLKILASSPKEHPGVIGKFVTVNQEAPFGQEQYTQPLFYYTESGSRREPHIAPSGGRISSYTKKWKQPYVRPAAANTPTFSWMEEGKPFLKQVTHQYAPFYEKTEYQAYKPGSLVSGALTAEYPESIYNDYTPHTYKTNQQFPPQLFYLPGARKSFKSGFLPNYSEQNGPAHENQGMATIALAGDLPQATSKTPDGEAVSSEIVSGFKPFGHTKSNLRKAFSNLAGKQLQVEITPSAPSTTQTHIFTSFYPYPGGNRYLYFGGSGTSPFARTQEALSRLKLLCKLACSVKPDSHLHDGNVHTGGNNEFNGGKTGPQEQNTTKPFQLPEDVRYLLQSYLPPEVLKKLNVNADNVREILSIICKLLETQYNFFKQTTRPDKINELLKTAVRTPTQASFAEYNRPLNVKFHGKNSSYVAVPVTLNIKNRFKSRPLHTNFSTKSYYTVPVTINSYGETISRDSNVKGNSDSHSGRVESRHGLNELDDKVDQDENDFRPLYYQSSVSNIYNEENSATTKRNTKLNLTSSTRNVLSSHNSFDHVDYHGLFTGDANISKNKNVQLSGKNVITSEPSGKGNCSASQNTKPAVQIFNYNVTILSDKGSNAAQNRDLESLPPAATQTFQNQHSGEKSNADFITMLTNLISKMQTTIEDFVKRIAVK